MVISAIALASASADELTWRTLLAELPKIMRGIDPSAAPAAGLPKVIRGTTRITSKAPAKKSTAAAKTFENEPVMAVLPPAIEELSSPDSVPRPLSAPDVDRYKRIFELQDESDWHGADRLIGKLEDIRLLGHVLAHRYLHDKYSTRYAEVRDWLKKYADLPEATRIYRLAMARKQANDQAPVEPSVEINRIGNPDAGREPTGPNWQAGLEAWRKGRMFEAAQSFERVAAAKGVTPWVNSAGAFWAARAHLKNHQPDKVSKWLKFAAEYPRTFYGQLARRALGMDTGLQWRTQPLDNASANALLKNRGGLRALALIQIGKVELAEDELHLLLESDAGAQLAPVVLAVAQAAGLPSVQIRVGARYEARTDVTLDAALYPVPAWQPTGGFSVDPALLFALMRQESAFDPSAKSPAGASGLMQLMPATAAWVSDANLMVGDQKGALLDPELNLTLAQRYVNELLRDPNVKGDLLMLAVAYNAGPGNLAKWRAKGAIGQIGYDQDPLLFIESIPFAETRQYVERVLSYYWIYQERFAEEQTSLDALASGAWPIYSPPESLKKAAAWNGPY
jgi:soluble lytic murein transglycosylase-like protein